MPSVLRDENPDVELTPEGAVARNWLTFKEENGSLIVDLESSVKLKMLKIKPICEFCPGAIGEDTPAEFLVPQSVDLGQTIEWKFVCFSHYDNWWDGADWKGTCFELHDMSTGRNK